MAKTCRFSEHRLIAEAFGEAKAELSQQVRSHVAGCALCTELLEQYRTLRARLQGWSAPAQEADGLWHARRALEARLHEPQRPRLRVQLWHSPVGDILLGATPKGVVFVEFKRPHQPSTQLARLGHELRPEQAGPDTEVSDDDRLTEKGTSPTLAALGQQLDEYFAGTRRTFDWTLDDRLMRSDFQRRVLRATTAIPYGTVMSYQGLADTIGQPTAVRAVAQALRHNPVPLHIPCHRVLGSDGRLTGYAGNLVDIKRDILETEGIPVRHTRRGLAVATAQMYVGWRSRSRLCRPDCSSLQGQTAGERVLIPSQARARELGYQPCPRCHPELHPLDKAEPAAFPPASG